MLVKKKNPIGKRRIHKIDPADEKLCMTNGQLMNIVGAIENPKDCCPKAKIFVKELKSKMRRSNTHPKSNL